MTYFCIILKQRIYLVLGFIEGSLEEPQAALQFKRRFVPRIAVCIAIFDEDEACTIFFWSDTIYVGQKGLLGSKFLTDSIVI